jgi:transglutaminase-like putative cysteine protease
MPRFTIHHITKYSYEGPVRDSASRIVLFPIKDEYQELLKQELWITGEPNLDIYKDYYGNEVGSFTHAEPHYSLVIDSKVDVITKPMPTPVDQVPAEDQWNHLQQVRWQVPFIDFEKQEIFASRQELLEDARIDEVRALTPMEATRALTRYVFDRFEYIKGVTGVETTLDEIWALKAGVCQDFAHILLVLLRHLHIPARYVSGYVCPNKNGMRGEGATHAWTEAYIPNNGWVGFDPTNNSVVVDRHVRLAVGRNFGDCSPVKGTYKGEAHHVLEVGVSVSYHENGETADEPRTILTPQPLKSETQQNSYRRYQEMMQQQ